MTLTPQPSAADDAMGMNHSHACHTLPSHAHTQATQEVVSRLPETTAAEFNAAVAAAKAAFPAWRATPVPTRQRVMLKFQELIRANWVSG